MTTPVTEYEIPFVPSIGLYNFSTTIGGTPYSFDARWNTRDAAWYVSLYEIDLTPIVLGVKVVLGAFLGRRCQHKLFRAGAFVAQDLSSQQLDAGFDDFGTRVIVKYIPVLDLMRRLNELPT